jgi:hypothetical protein
MKIWVIITTSLIQLDYEQRKKEYIGGITSILNKFKAPKYNVVIVENTSKLENPFNFHHRTFLNNFKVPVLYTKNNILIKKTKNYGIIEMIDVFNCINHFGIQDDDFIVKVTGRYVLDENSSFFNVVDNLENKPYTAILRFSQFDEPLSLVKTNNCTTGIIGLKCKYIKQIEIPDLDDIQTSIEMKWAKVICKLDDSEICFLEKLGIYIKPRCLSAYSGYYHI